MKEIITQLWQGLAKSTPAARIVMAAGAVLALVVVGASMYRSANPHMEFFVGDLDNSSFSKATRALSQGGVRFETSTGGEPYTIFVESGSKFKAHNAIAGAGALDMGALGINTNGSSNAWDSSVERMQKADARYWQEVEKQLTQLHWVRAAKVVARQPTNRILGRAPRPTVSVILTTRGMRPSSDQSANVGNIVRTAFNVPEENITILDQNGSSIFDGKRKDNMDEHLAYQQTFDQENTDRIQTLLDDVYGPGLTRVLVNSDWSFVQTETVGETLGPKSVVNESTRKSSSPVPILEGGPAGLEESFNPAAGGSSTVANDPSTQSESDKQYTYGTQTTHRVENAPLLKRLSVSLTLDASLQEQAEAITEQVKAATGFQSDRGDVLSTHTTALNGVERDEEGNPIPVAAVEAPEPPNAMMGMLMERGIELVALLVFLVFLLRTLKQAKVAANPQAQRKEVAADGSTIDPDIEIDPSLLARKHIENLLESDPDRVSSLLSRWAMGDDFLAKAKS